MAYPARLLAAALLTAALAVPATLQASGPSNVRPAARADGGSSSRAAATWSFDWLLRFVHPVLPECGGGLDPNGGCAMRPRPQCGPGLDPTGGCAMKPPPAPTAGGGLRRNG
jgi:hypothetical protein